MKRVKLVSQFWNEMKKANYDSIRQYFQEEATISWPNTKEYFTVEEFIRVNKMYPGEWEIEVCVIEETLDSVFSTVHIKSKSGQTNVYANSQFRFHKGLISLLTEYFSDSADIPSWRRSIN